MFVLEEALGKIKSSLLVLQIRKPSSRGVKYQSQQIALEHMPVF